jgi:hypothetical protein
MTRRKRSNGFATDEEVAQDFEYGDQLDFGRCVRSWPDRTNYRDYSNAMTFIDLVPESCVRSGATGRDAVIVDWARNIRAFLNSTSAGDRARTATVMN